MIIVAYNPDTSHLERTYLGKSYAAGVSAFLVKNTNGFTDGKKILMGAMSRERSEILTVLDTGLTKTNLPTTTNSSFPHDADDPVYVLEYDKIRIYRSTTGSGGSYSLLATIDIDVDNADGATYYDDANALTTYWYKICYYDSVDDVESEYTAPMAATGYTLKQLGSFIPQIAKDVGDPEFLENDIATYIAWMNDINSDLLTQAKRPYRFLKDEVPIDIEEDDSSFPFPTDLWKINFIEANDISASSTRVYQPKRVSTTEARFQLGQYILGGDYVDGIAVDDENNVVMFYPKARADRIGAFRLHYYKEFTEFTSLADTIQTPNSLIYKYGIKAMIYNKKADDDQKYFTKAKDFDQKYNAEVMKLQREKQVIADAPSGMGPDRKRYLQWGGRKYRQ